MDAEGAWTKRQGTWPALVWRKNIQLTSFSDLILSLQVCLLIPITQHMPIVMLMDIAGSLVARLEPTQTSCNGGFPPRLLDGILTSKGTLLGAAAHVYNQSVNYSGNVGTVMRIA